MDELSFTNIRSLLGALAKALNLINPAVENHHEAGKRYYDSLRVTEG